MATAQRQQYIEGTEPPRIAELDELAEEFREKRDAWMAVGDEMRDAKAALLEAMQQHLDELCVDADGHHVYPIPDTDQEVTLLHKTTDDVKVRTRRKVVAADAD